MSTSVSGNTLTFANDPAGWEHFRQTVNGIGLSDGKRAFFLYQGFCVYSEVH
jgi:hypothetical protein